MKLDNIAPISDANLAFLYELARLKVAPIRGPFAPLPPKPSAQALSVRTKK